jgi:hypothetical protein
MFNAIAWEDGPWLYVLLDIDGEYSIISVGFKLSNGVALLGLKYSAFTFLSLTLVICFLFRHNF